MEDEKKHNGIKEKISISIGILVLIGFFILVGNLLTGIGEFLWDFAPASDKYSFDEFIIWMIIGGFGLYAINKLDSIERVVKSNQRRIDQISNKMHKS